MLQTLSWTHAQGRATKGVVLHTTKSPGQPATDAAVSQGATPHLTAYAGLRKGMRAHEEATPLNALNEVT